MLRNIHRYMHILTPAARLRDDTKSAQTPQQKPTPPVFSCEVVILCRQDQQLRYACFEMETGDDDDAQVSCKLGLSCLPWEFPLTQGMAQLPEVEGRKVTQAVHTLRGSTTRNYHTLLTSLMTLWTKLAVHCFPQVANSFSHHSGWSLEAAMP